MPFGIDDMLILYGAAELGKLIVGLDAAEKAGRINKETLNRLRDLGDRYQQEMMGNLPPGTVTPLELEEFKTTVQKYVPEVYKYTPEATPQQITEASVSGEKQAQKQALQQYGRLAQAGYDPIAAAQQEQALSAGAAQASVARQAALREAAQRGMAGTGLESLAGIGAAEQAGMEGRQAVLGAQAEAGQRRLQALGQYANLAGQMRQQGTATEQANVGIMNAFNERAARGLNQYNQYVAELQNQAQQQNRSEQLQREQMNLALRNQQAAMNWQAKRQAEAERRAAVGDVFRTKYKIQSGLGEMQGTMDSQALAKQTAAGAEGLGALSKVSSMGIQSYYDAQAKKKKASEDDTEE